MEWIKLSDRKPEEGELILVYCPSFYRCPIFSASMHRGDGNYYFINKGSTLSLEVVTHWMPLPEPPKENKHVNWQASKIHVIEGRWDMDNDAKVSIENKWGIDGIAGIDFVIRDNARDIYYFSAKTPDLPCRIYFTDTKIILERDTAGRFDCSGFDNASYQVLVEPK